MKIIRADNSLAPILQENKAEVNPELSTQALESQVTALKKELDTVNHELQTLIMQNQVFSEEKEKHDEALKQIEERLRLLVLGTSTITWTSNAEEEFTTREYAWERFTGQRYAQYQGLGWLNALHPEDLSTFIESWRAAKQVKSNYQANVRVYSIKYQGYRYIIMRAMPLLDTNGEICAWLGSAFDVTTFKEKEEALRINIEHLNLALKSAQIGTWHWDIEQDIMTWGGHMHPIFGNEPGMYKGNYQEFLQRVAADNREPFNQSIQDALKSTDSFNNEYRILWPDGSTRIIACRGETHSNEQNVPLCMNGICWDITEQRLQEQKYSELAKKAQEHQRLQEEEADKYRKNLEEFINLICHEIRNPLNGFMGSTEWLKDAQRVLTSALNLVSTSDALKEQIEAAQTIIDEVIATNEACAAHQLTVVNDVLDLSKLAAQALVLDEVIFNPIKVAQEVARMFRSSFVEKHLTFKLHLPDEVTIVKGDALRFKTILINLVTNALKFTPAGGFILRLDYNASQTGDIDFKVVAEDTGIGMTAEQQKHIFERFKQGSQSIYNQASSSGLGLLIAKQLAHLMGGDIYVESEVGKGTRFTVTGRFKRATEEEQRVFWQKEEEHIAARALNQELGKAKKILIVEDNVINQKVLSALLNKQGSTYVIANDGLEALEQLKTQVFDLILMDIYMPRMSGLEAARHIRQQEKENSFKPIPIIGLSGQAQERSIKEAFEAGMNNYLTKPFHKETLYEKIAHWTNHPLPAQTEGFAESTTTSTSPLFSSSR